MKQGEGNCLPSLTITFTLTPVMPMNKGMQEVGGSVEAEMIKLSRDNFPLKAIKLQNLLEQSILLSQTFLNFCLEKFAWRYSVMLLEC